MGHYSNLNVRFCPFQTEAKREEEEREVLHTHGARPGDWGLKSQPNYWIVRREMEPFEDKLGFRLTYMTYQVIPDHIYGWKYVSYADPKPVTFFLSDVSKEEYEQVYRLLAQIHASQDQAAADRKELHELLCRLVLRENPDAELENRKS